MNYPKLIIDFFLGMFCACMADEGKVKVIGFIILIIGLAFLCAIGNYSNNQKGGNYGN